MDELDWKPIDTAPRDGRPIWVRGWNWGNESQGRHYSWAYWNGTDWQAAGAEASHLKYLTDWLPPVDKSGGTL